MVENNKTIARRVREEIWNKKNLNVADEIIGANCVHHVHDPITPHLGKGAATYKQLVTAYLTAFPDAHITVEDVVSEGDKTVVRWTARATHKGELMGTPPTGKQATVTGIDIYRIAGGKIEEIWVNWDTMGLLKQLGITAQVARPS